MFHHRTGTLLAVALVTFAGIAAACGDDDDDTGGQATLPAGAPTAATAAEMVPDVSALGFEPAGDDAPVLETPNTKVAIFEDPDGPVRSLRLDIALVPNEQAAQNQFGTFGDALRNPPPGLFPAGVKQTDGTPVYQADQSRSYQTDRPDDQGGIVYTDLHRFGRAVVIMYVIGEPGTETEAVRKQVAELLAPKAPR